MSAKKYKNYCLIHNINGDNMNVLVTGAASNIGFDIAIYYSLKHKVYLTVHKDSEIESVRNKIGSNSNIECFKLDITDINDYCKLDNLDIDIMINNAGVYFGCSVIDIPIDTLKYSYEVNVFSNIRLIKYVYSKMIQGGKIFVISSLASMIPLELLGGYVSSKASLSMLTMCMSKELQNSNSKCEVILVEPGAYHTGFNQVMIDNKELFMNKDEYYYKVDKMQRLIFRLIESKNIRVITKKIYKESLKKKSKKKIKVPVLGGILIKIYLLLKR